MFGFVSKEMFLEVETIITEFALTELRLSSVGGISPTDSVIVNIATFDLASLSSVRGLEQMERLLQGSSHTQNTSVRLRTVLLYLHCRYGVARINRLRKRVLAGVGSVYGLSMHRLADIDSRNNTFWLVPFIKRGYTKTMKFGPPE